MPDDLDYSAVFSYDPAGKAAAMARVLRGQQAQAQRDTVLYGHPEAVPGMVSEGQQRALQGAQALKEYAALQNQMRHEGVQEDLDRARLGLTAQNQQVEQGLNKARTEAEIRLKDLEAQLKGRLPPEALAQINALNSGEAAVAAAQEQFAKDPKGYLAGHPAHGAAVGQGIFPKDNPNAAKFGAAMLPGPELLYASQLPDEAGGSFARSMAAKKFDALRDQIREKRAGLLSTYASGGYSPPAAPGAPESPKKAPEKAPADAHAAALKWVQDNEKSKDPKMLEKVAAVKRKLGAK